MSMLSHQSGSIEKYTIYRACGKTPTAFSTPASGVPIHSAIYDQPSSQATSVIWLCTGRLLRSDSESDAGRATIPSTVSRQSVKPAAWCRLKASLDGAVALANGAFEIMLRGNSRASDCVVIIRCAAYVSVSPAP